MSHTARSGRSDVEGNCDGVPEADALWLGDAVLEGDCEGLSDEVCVPEPEPDVVNVCDLDVDCVGVASPLRVCVPVPLGSGLGVEVPVKEAVAEPVLVCETVRVCVNDMVGDGV